MNYEPTDDVIEELKKLFFSEIIEIESRENDDQERDFTSGEEMQTLQRADNICERYEVPVTERPEVIVLGLREAYSEYVEQAAEEMKQSIEMLYSFGGGGRGIGE